jgi:hypothetical protein
MRLSRFLSLLFVTIVIVPFAYAHSTAEPDYTIPVVDISTQTYRQVIVDKSPTQYLGHADTVMLDDNKTIFAVYPIGHGRGPIVLKKSVDQGLTWSKRLIIPPDWATSDDVPTIHKITDPNGLTRLFVFTGHYPIRMSVSEDMGNSWSKLKPIGDFGGIVAMTRILQLPNGKALAFFCDNGLYINESCPQNKGTSVAGLCYMTRTDDGGLTWNPPKSFGLCPLTHLCDPGPLFSPDKKQIAVLFRENNRKLNSHISFSDDSGNSWSTPKPLAAALTGDRHVARYAPDGRLVVVFRDTTLVSKTKGDFVAWVGSYQDILNGTEGQYRIRLLDNHYSSVKKNDSDCGYAGLEVLSDGSFIATTYGHFIENEPAFIMSVRFKLCETDKILAEQKI